MSEYDPFSLDDSQPSSVDPPTITNPADYQGPDSWCDPGTVEQAVHDGAVETSTLPPDESITPVEDPPWPQTEHLAELQEDADKWFLQSTDFTCGPAAVTQILEDFTGQQFDNELLVAQDAAQLGWLSDKGMPLEAVDDLLTRWGVPSHIESGGPDPYTALQTVDQYIEEGRSVVMFVDASEYWQGVDADTYHFVRILDVDMGRGVAVLSDSGHPNGQGLEVPLATLAEAWNEGLEHENAHSYGMVVSDVADPDGVGASEQVMATASVTGSALATGQTAIAPGQPFCLLPATLSPEGYQAVMACCGGPVDNSGFTIASENPMDATPTGP